MGLRPFRALVVSRDDDIGASRLPRLLDRAGCRVTALAPRGSALLASRFVAEPVPGSRGPDAFLTELCEVVTRRARNYEWIVVTDEDVLAGLFALAPSEPWAAKCLPVDCSRAESRALIDREVFAGAFGDGGEAPPAGARVRTGTAVCLFDRGSLVRWMTCHKARTFHGRGGPASAYVLVGLPALRPELERVGRALEYRGLAGIDFAHDPTTGRTALVGMSSRPIAIARFGEHVGLDFSSAMRVVSSGQPMPERGPGKHDCGFYMPLFPQDPALALRDRDWAHLGQWMYQPAWWHDVPLDDPMLLARLLMRGRRIARRRRKAPIRLPVTVTGGVPRAEEPAA